MESLFDKKLIELLHSISKLGHNTPCADNPDLFFHETIGGRQSNANTSVMMLRERVAKGLCSECPVKRQCGQYAIDTKQEFGIWGGTSAADRRIISYGEETTPE